MLRNLCLGVTSNQAQTDMTISGNMIQGTIFITHENDFFFLIRGAMLLYTNAV